MPRDQFRPNWSPKTTYLMCKGPGPQAGWIWGQRCPLLHGFTTLSPCYPFPPSRALSPAPHFKVGIQCRVPSMRSSLATDGSTPDTAEAWEQMAQGLGKPGRNPLHSPGAPHPQLLNTPSQKSLSIYLTTCQTVTEWQYAFGLWIFKHVYFIWTLKTNFSFWK